MSGWPRVTLGEVLCRSNETIDPLPDAEYREITVRLWGKGVIERGRVNGLAISGRRFVAREGQFIASRIDARNGAMGVVPKVLDGALVTNDFPLFDVNRERALPSFLGWMSRTEGFVSLCLHASEGTTNRVRLKEAAFLSHEIALPSLAEQRQVVAQMEGAQTQVVQALALCDDTERCAATLAHQAINGMVDSPRWPREVLGTLLLEPPRNGISPKPEADRHGRPMLRINAVSSARGRLVEFDAAKVVTVSDVEAAPFEICEGDVFLVRYNGDIERVAKAAIARGVPATRPVYPDKLMRLRVNQRRITPDFLVLALAARSVRSQVESLGRTTAGNIGINGTQVRSFAVPTPPLADQRALVAALDTAQAEVNALRASQAARRTELEALLPAILDRAFAGAL